MGALFSRLKVWVSLEDLTAANLNAEFDNILTNLVPLQFDDYSVNIAQMQVTTDPGEVGTESLATSMAGELERIRFVLNEIKGTTQWYSSSTTSLAEIASVLGGGLTPNRITSGKSTSLSSQPAFLVPDGAARTVTLEGAVTPFVYSIDGISYTISTDVAVTLLVAAPASNNTALVNDATINDTDGTKLVGEYGTELAIDTVGSEISSKNGTLAAFQVNNGSADEYFVARVDTTNGKLFGAQRGYFFNSSDNLIPRVAIANNDTLTLMNLTWVFAKTDLTLAVSYNEPRYSKDEPTSPSVGDYWFDLANDTWKTFNSTIWVSAGATLVGACIQDATNTIGARGFDFFKSFEPQNTVELATDSVTEVKGTALGQQLSVYGTALKWEKDYIRWNTGTDFESGVTEAASTRYFLYLTEAGDPMISDKAPRDMTPDRKGYYHPEEAWRCVGEVYNDSGSDFTGAVSYSNITDEDYQISSSISGSALTVELVVPLVQGYEFRDATLTTGESKRFHILERKSLTITSGATLSHKSTEEHPVYSYILNDGGIKSLAVSSRLQDEGILQTSVAMDATADNSLLYSAAVATDKAVRLFGRYLSTQTTAGTWDAAMTSSSVSRDLIGLRDRSLFLAITSSIKTPGASGDWLAMSSNSFTLTKGNWALYGAVIYNANTKSANYTAFVAQWSSANGADNGTPPAALTIVAGSATGAKLEVTTANIETASLSMSNVRVSVATTQVVFLVPNVLLSTPSDGRVTTYMWAERLAD